MEKKKSSLAVRMSISLVCGLVAGLLLMFLRENLNSTGKEAVWATINSILFQDITAAGAEKALGIFYIVGQLFIRSLQLVIVPMVFTSITLAIGQISDTRTLGRISVKTIAGFLICSFFALLMACVVGIMVYNAGVFNIQVEGLEGSAGSTGSNPLNVILNIVPSNITAVFSTNTSVLAIVFLAVSLGLCMKAVGDEKSAALKKLITEVNDIVVVFLNYVVTKFGPIAIFVLLARTFATYGINHLKPALAYVVVTVILLLVFLFIGYPIFVAVTTKQNPVKFAKKIFRVAVFGFSTSSSAAALPLNVKTTTEELGVDEKIASFVKNYEAAYKMTPSQFAADAYDAIYTIKAAMEKAEIADVKDKELNAKLIDAMTKIEVDGVTGKMTWDANGEPTKSAQAVVIKDGAYVEYAD